MSSQSITEAPAVVRPLRKGKRAAPDAGGDDAPTKKAQVEKEFVVEFVVDTLKETSREVSNHVVGIFTYAEKITVALSEWSWRLEKYLPHYSKSQRTNLCAEYANFLAIKLFLADVGAEHTVSPPAKIDDIWHLHVLDTFAYAKFCNKIGHVFHHSPGDAIDRDARNKRLALCIKVYEVVLRRKPPPEIWDERALPQDEKERMNVYVKRLTGSSMQFSVYPTTTALELKCMIYGRDNIPIDQLRLVFDGKQLENAKTMADYNINDNATVLLVLRLRGC